MGKTTGQVLESKEFKKIVRDRWTIAFILTAIEFIMYYGYVVLVATNKELLSHKIGAATTLGIPLGIGVIVVSWVLTYIYVMWANSKYDPEVETMINHLKGGKK